MRKMFRLAIICMAIFFELLANNSMALSFGDLRPDIPACKTPVTKRQKLKAETSRESDEAIKTGWYTKIVADFTGNGWCGFALGVPYPVNSQMESYSLDDIMLLGGGEGWRHPFKGKKSYLPPVSDLDFDVWPRHAIDLTDIRFVYPRRGGAPYILGVNAGTDAPKVIVTNEPLCEQYATVYQWDSKVDGLKKVDKNVRNIVIKYFYSTIERDCSKKVDKIYKVEPLR